MHVADQTKLILGVICALVGLGILAATWRQRGFDQRKQIGALLVAASILFICIGFGWLDIKALLGR